MKEHFEIVHMDSLGQGVSKIGSKVTFIPKVLPGETGEAEIQKRKSKVQFGTMTKLATTSSERVPPICPHFAQCPGCHYLHTNYDNELKIKQNTLQFNLKGVLPEGSQINLIRANKRDGHRNRIQLHYDHNKRKLGFIQRYSREIIEVPNCIIGTPKVTEHLKQLYHNSSWAQLVSTEHSSGHIEIYELDGVVKLSVNAPYASGGFSQVNSQMNHQLQRVILESIGPATSGIIDLFGGTGNLTRELAAPTLVVDNSTINNQGLPPHQTFMPLNLYKKGSLSKLIKTINQSSFDTLILDPPRSGYLDLNNLLLSANIDKIIYVSCFFPTMIRDLRPVLNRYQLQTSYLIDLFPSSYHFESIVVLQKQ
jgi:23S rRNA (uracil1939-C5)-methyltransferase